MPLPRPGKSKSPRKVFGAKMMTGEEIKTVIGQLQETVAYESEGSEGGGKSLFTLACWQIAAELDEIRYLLREAYKR
jgi:hypothetical protein